MIKPFFRSIITASLLAGQVGCSSVFYQPTPYQYTDRARLLIQPEDIDFTSEDGTRLHAWYFKAKGRSKGLIVQFHGNAQNLTSHWGFLRNAPWRDYDHFVFDYRGYGQSEGRPSPEGMVRDGRAALAFAVKRWPKLPLFVFAQSLGGAIAMRTLLDMRERIKPRAIFLDSTFMSYRSEARKVMANHILTWPLQPLAWAIVDNSQSPGRSLSALAPTPIFVIHGQADNVVPYELGRRTFEAAAEPKEFWEVPGGHHTEFMMRPELAKKFFDKLDELSKN